MVKPVYGEDAALLEKMRAGEETVWVNLVLEEASKALKALDYSAKDVKDASDRLKRFAPLLMRVFPETEKTGGLIESPVSEIPGMKAYLNERGAGLTGRLFLKRDSELAVAGSVKARGGIYEVLRHTETLALENGLLSGTDDDYTKLLSEESRAFFATRRVEVGSTGNLGMSIGIMSAALGYDARVHMSSDAKQWKKDLLRSRGVTVIEYDGDYSEAVKQGRALSDLDPASYFVDDEKSADLFLGYAVAAERLEKQLAAEGIHPDKEHPLSVYIPCGVGGAPGGILFGLKLLFGDAVNVWFCEPVEVPSMQLGLVTGLHEKISVTEFGLSGKTEADGLACGRPSGLISNVAEHLVSGGVTAADTRLLPYLRALYKADGFFIEPSSCAAFTAPHVLYACGKVKEPGENAVHIVWATGGSLIPEGLRNSLING